MMKNFQEKLEWSWPVCVWTTKCCQQKVWNFANMNNAFCANFPTSREVYTQDLLIIIEKNVYCFLKKNRLILSIIDPVTWIFKQRVIELQSCKNKVNAVSFFPFWHRKEKSSSFFPQNKVQFHSYSCWKSSPSQPWKYVFFLCLLFLKRSISSFNELNTYKFCGTYCIVGVKTSSLTWAFVKKYVDALNTFTKSSSMPCMMGIRTVRLQIVREQDESDFSFD